MHVLYDGPKGGRLTKKFTDLYEARRFWFKMYRAGRDPKYRNPNKEIKP